MMRDAIVAGMAAMGISSPDRAVAQLADYLALIAKWNKVHNLTAIQDPARMVVEHVLDSLSVVPYIRPERVLDIGSGAGLPGIPLAIVRPRWRVTLLDSSHKRSTFQRQAAIELGLSNTEIVCARVEQFRPVVAFDTIVSRAFSDLGSFAAGAVEVLADDGVIVAMKGLYPKEELEKLPASVRVREVVKLDVPGLHAQRHAVLMTRA